MLLARAIRTFLVGYFATCERSTKTVAAYTSDLRQFRRTQPAQRHLHAIQPDDIEAWAQALKHRGLAPASLKRKMAVLKIFFNYWVRKGSLDRSPAWLLRLDLGKSRPLTRTLARDELFRLLKAAKAQAAQDPEPKSGDLGAPFLALRNWCLLELLFATGMRVGEATSLLLTDVRLEEGTVLVRGKGGRQRLAFLTEATSCSAVATYLQGRRRVATNEPALFLTSRGLPLTSRGVALVLRKLASEAGISRHITPHMLRHTSATLLLQNGADLRIVQEFLGHSSITTTQRYTHVSQTHLLQALRSFHPRLHLSA